MSTRPFRFSGLKRLTREQVALHESLVGYLSGRPFEPNFNDELAASLERYLKVPCNFAESELRPVARAELASLLPAVGCIVVVGAAPLEQKILVEIDPTLVSFTIDKLLGGSGDNGRIQRPLTEIEEGVLSFVVLKLLSQFHTGWHTGKELALTLDRFASKLDDVQALIDAEASFHLLAVRVAVGGRAGYARILIPQSLITKTFATPPAQGAALPHELVHMRRGLQAMGTAVVEGRVEVATLDLGPEDVANLEVGDIVVLENPNIKKSALGLEGIVLVKLGAGQNGGLRARLVNEGETSHLEVVEIIVQEEPQEEVMAKEAGAEEAQDDNLAETQGLLRDVPAPVVVELGRIKLNTQQVARLRAGQILKLPRGPNDPVDLVVNGKLFARGELIEVDGELGVRLMQIAGS